LGRARMSFLTKKEEDLVHSHSLRCLEELGVLVRSARVLRLLEDAGAGIDHKTGLAKIPEHMVTDALQTTPKRIVLAARDREHDLEIPVRDIPYATNSGLAIYMADLDSGENRCASRRDLADFARLVDALECLDFFWTAVVPMDVLDRSHAVHQLWTSLQSTTKHVQQIEVMGAEDAKTQIALASIAAGGEEELRTRPLFSAVCSPVSPLSFERATIEAQVELSKAGIPVVSMTSPLSGLTAPVTVGGTINVANTENLASLVISQAAAEGAPFIYSSAAVPGDMRSGEADYGAVEVPFIFAGLGQMADRYSVPRMIGDWGLCGGSNAGIDGAFSEVSSVALDTFSGTDLLSGMGSIDNAKGVSLEQLVIDAYVWRNWRLFLREVDVDEASMAFDVLKDVGHGGTFLSHPHTLRNFRAALSRRDATGLAWEATLSDKMVPEAKGVAKRILAEHRVEPLSPQILEEGNAIIREYEGR
jgi:trimethylamine--corrinoid protein Co-methyltransferase